MSVESSTGVTELPFVAVGPTAALSVTVSQNTFSTAFIVVTLIIGLLVIVILGLTIFFAFRNADLPPPPPPLPLGGVSSLN